MSTPPDRPQQQPGPYGQPDPSGAPGPYGPSGSAQPYGPPPGGAGEPGGYGGLGPDGPPLDIVSVLGLVLGFLLAPVGLVLSILGLVRTSGGRRRGRGFAIAGVVVSLVVTVLLGLLIAALVAFGNFVTSEYSTTIEQMEQEGLDEEGFDMEEFERLLEEEGDVTGAAQPGRPVAAGVGR